MPQNKKGYVAGIFGFVSIAAMGAYLYHRYWKKAKPLDHEENGEEMEENPAVTSDVESNSANED